MLPVLVVLVDTSAEISSPRVNIFSSPFATKNPKHAWHDNRYWQKSVTFAERENVTDKMGVKVVSELVTDREPLPNGLSRATCRCLSFHCAFVWVFAFPNFNFAMMISQCTDYSCQRADKFSLWILLSSSCSYWSHESESKGKHFNFKVEVRKNSYQKFAEILGDKTPPQGTYTEPYCTVLYYVVQ